jgi:hypothetical protein
MPPQFKLVLNAISTGKRHADEMLGEYLVPPIIEFNANLRESDDVVVHPGHVEDYNAVTSRRLCGKSSRLCGVSNEDNGVTSIKDEAFQIREASDDKAFRICEAADEGLPRSKTNPSAYVKRPMIKSSGHVKQSDEDIGSTSATDHVANDSTSAVDNRKTPDHVETDTPNVETWPMELVGIIYRITRLPISKMEDHEFKFELSIEAADENASVLIDKYRGNLSDAINAKGRSILGYGSEFRPVEEIAKIYKNHPLWDRTYRDSRTIRML